MDLDPTLNLGWKGLGQAYWADQKIDQAVAAWVKAVETDGTDADSILNLGQAYLEKKYKARALICFERYLELEGNRISSENRRHILAFIETCKRWKGMNPSFRNLPPRPRAAEESSAQANVTT